jgi:phenylacetate-CoA ligase
MAFLEQSSNFSREQLQDYKLQRLLELVRHAAINVPYYRDLYQRHGVDLDRIKNLSDFSGLPTVDRNSLNLHRQRFLAENSARHQPILTRTSGTSGGYTELYRSKEQESFRAAVQWQFFLTHGYKYRERRVHLEAPKSYESDSPVATHNRLENVLQINSYHVMSGNHQAVVDAIREFRPRLIWALPNLLFVLARHILEQRQDPVEVPLVITYGEKLYPHLRDSITQAFAGAVREDHGNRENSVAARGNGDSRFREVSEYCHLELRTGATATGDNSGELVTTSLHNFAFPLIRYLPGDLVENLDYLDSERYPGFDLLGGRGKDLLLTRDGLMCSYVFKHLRNNGFFKLKWCQLEQLSLDRLVARAVTQDSYKRDSDESTLIRLLEEALLGYFRVEIEYVDEITFTRAGKFQPIISRPAVEYLQGRSGT